VLSKGELTRLSVAPTCRAVYWRTQKMIHTALCRTDHSSMLPPVTTLPPTGFPAGESGMKHPPLSLKPERIPPNARIPPEELRYLELERQHEKARQHERARQAVNARVMEQQRVKGVRQGNKEV
jgi:hypothetical protein